MNRLPDNPINHRVTRTLLFTLMAMIAFAANSVLCRLALGEHAIDAASFTEIRLFSGALMLFLILKTRSNSSSSNGSWFAGAMLFLYAMTFSYAYLSLSTGTGALILFGSVQITMIAFSLFAGERLNLSEWTGLVIAFAGFVYLVLPGASAPSLSGFLLMTVAGIAWGFYTLRGRGSTNPLADTACNFIRTLPLVMLLALVSFSTQQVHYSTNGILLAILSGALASGAGYTIWYIALRGLVASQAAVVQLSVPVIAAFGGVIFVSESITLRLALSASLILGGILLVMLGRYYFVRK